ncbi:jg17702, partial [Pararge aegeria aegeria]
YLSTHNTSYAYFVILPCNGVAEQRTAYLGSPASQPQALGHLGGLLSFWSELGWLEWSSGEPYQWHYVQRKVPADQVRRQAQEEKDECFFFITD